MNVSLLSKRLNATTLIVIAAFAAAIGLWLGSRYLATPTSAKFENAVLYPQPRELPEFQLTQANGHPLTNTDWHGHWSLVYFGYTSCPDVCPTTLTILKQAWANLAKAGLQDKVRIDFISVDPERDTSDVLGKYVSFFSPDFIAASGSDEQLTLLTRALGLVYARSKAADGTIQVDHSGSVVIVDPQARLIGMFRPPFIAAAISNDLAALLAQN